MHITGFPGDGPDATRPGHDLTYLAESGMLHHLFGRDLAPSTPIADISGGMFAALMLCVAVIERHKTGKGRYIEINLAVGAAEDKFFDRFVSELGYPEFAGKGRCLIRDEIPIYRTLRNVFYAHNADYWISWAKKRDLPISQVESPVPGAKSYRLPLRVYEQ